MNFSMKYFNLLVAFLLLWCSESTIEAKQIIKSGQNSDIHIEQQVYKNPSGVFSYLWRRHNRTTTLKPNSTTEQWNTTTTISNQSTTLFPNTTTERQNTTTVLYKSKNLKAVTGQQYSTTAAQKSTSYHPKSTAEQWNTTTAAHESTSYHPKSTSEQWNATTAAHESTSYHSNPTTQQWKTTTVPPVSTRGKITYHHHFRRRTTITQ